MKTQNDYIGAVNDAKARLVEAEQKIDVLNKRVVMQEHALRHARMAIEEAIAFTGRWQEMANLPPDVFHDTFKKRLRQIGSLHVYFLQCKANFNQVLQGFPVAEAERPKLDEDSGNNAGKGARSEERRVGKECRSRWS